MTDIGHSTNMDPGTAAVEACVDRMQIDSEWIVREDRGFTWWGGPHAQRVRAEPGVDDDGIVVYRLYAEADVLRDVEITPDVLGKLNAFNHMCVTSALIADPAASAIRYATSMWVHEETTEWLSWLWPMVVGMQAAMANSQGEFLSAVLGGTPAESEHPASGRRDDRDDWLLFNEQVVVPRGQSPSTWAGPEISSFTDAVRRSWANVVVNGGEAGLALELPFGERTSLLQVHTDQPHPSLGNGMLVRTSLPVHIPDDEAPSWANDMNQRKCDAFTRAHFLGSWVVSDGTPTFVTFYPNVTKTMDGDGMSLLFSHAQRARWIADAIESDGWTAPDDAEAAPGDIPDRSTEESDTWTITIPITTRKDGWGGIDPLAMLRSMLDPGDK